MKCSDIVKIFSGKDEIKKVISGKTDLWSSSPNHFLVTASAVAHGLVSGSGVYERGKVANLQATPDSGFGFVRWSDGNICAERDIVVTEDVNIKAHFAPLERLGKVIYWPGF